MTSERAIKVFKGIIKALGWTIASILALLILLILLIRTPYVQNILVGKAEGYLEQKLDTEVSIGGAYLNFPKSIEVTSLYVEDLQADTLLSFNSLEVDTDLWALLDNKIQINSLTLDQAVGKISKGAGNKDFNFQFIIEAFAGNDTIQEPKNEPWVFDVKDIQLSSVRFTMDNKADSMFLNASLSELGIEVDQLNLDEPSLKVHSIDLVGATFNYKKSKSSIPSDATESEPSEVYDFQLGEVTISKSAFEYQTPEQRISGNIGQLALEMEQMSLPDQNLAVERISLKNSELAFISISTTTSDSTSSESTPNDAPWNVTAAHISLANNDLILQLDSTQHTDAQFNPQHLNISQLNADIRNSSYTTNSIHTEVRSLDFLTDQVPMQVKGDFTLTSSQIMLSKSRLQLGNSDLNFEALAAFDKLQNLIHADTEFELSVSTSQLYFNDFSYFVPALAEAKLPKQLSLEGNVKGRLGNLNVSELNARTANSELFLTANIQSLPEIEKIRYNIKKLNIESAKGEFLPYLPDSLKAQLALPPSIKLNATGQGSLSSFIGQLQLNSSYGNIALAVDSLYLQDSIPHYKLRANSKGISVGRIIKQNDGNLDNLQFDLKLAGVGIDPTSLKASATGSISNIRYNNYTYNSVTLDAKMKQTLIDGNIQVNDDHLSLSLNGDVDISSELHKNHMTLDLQKADLQTLNFSRTPLLLQGKLITNFETQDFRKYNGDISIHDFSADNDIDVYSVDSLLVASIEQDGLTHITIDSDIMQGVFKGTIDLFTVSEGIQQHINQYYDLKEVSNDSIPEMDFTFDLDLKNTDLITEILLPELQEFEPGHFKTVFDSKANLLDVEFGIHHLKYQDITIDDFTFNSKSSDKKLTSHLSIDQIASAKAQIKNFNIDAMLEDNELTSSLIVIDSIGQKKYNIKSVIQSVDSAYQLSLDTDQFILNYERWAVEQDRPLIIGNSILQQSTTLRISKGEQAISFKTLPTDSTLQVGFHDFSLKTIGAALKKQEEILNGKVNGTVDILFDPAQVAFMADIDIDGLTLMKKQWGDFKLNISPTKRDTYFAKIDLKSSVNKISVTSEYDLNEIEQTSLTATIDKFDLATLAPLVEGSVQNLDGNLQGKLILKNGFTPPNINGSLTVNDLTVNPLYLNNTLSVENETINFNNSLITLNRFKLKDENGNSAVIDGQVEMVDLSFYNLDLSLTANNFMLLNTTSEDNELYYGILKTDGRVTIKGSSLRPTISANLKLLEESNITYVVPESEYTMASSENVVEFINVNEEAQQEAKAPEDSLKFMGLELSAKLEIDKSAKLNVVIDPITQDKLSVQGAALLNLDMDRKGDIQLSGKYTVEQGQYNFSFYKLIKREFEIDKGSTITWTGDPFEALLEITAYNKVEAPPIDLMINQINNASTSELEKYKQLLPFLVYLNINGILSRPEITFRLDMPQDKQNAFGGSVYARLVDLNSRESDLNKQVFALLMLQRFVSENSLKSEGGYDVEDKTRRSVSRILSDQLNRLTDNVNAVDINFDLQSYQNYGEGSTSSTTKLELGLSKSLFNDQLEVKVAGNVNLEGQQQKSVSDYIGDLALEYKITEDGRLKITGFRRSDFDVISGEIVESGVGIIYVRDYSAFKELFKKKDEK